MCEAHAQGDIVDQVLTSFEGSLAAALEDRAHGRLAAHVIADELADTGTGAMSHPSGG